MRLRPRLSIPRRVFWAFALVLTVSGAVGVTSLVQHTRTADTLGLIHEGYLPLVLTLGEARATQRVFDTLLDRVMSERDTSATRRWLDAARRQRVNTLQAAITRMGELEARAGSADRDALERVRRELERIRSSLVKGAERYEALFSALKAGDKESAERSLADLRGRERVIERRLRASWDTILSQIETTSAQAADRQTQAIAVLAALILVLLITGIAVTWWSQRVLSPLPRLRDRVEAVARGDFVHQLGPATDDEIGRLAQEFERMVAALAARDQSLQQATETLRNLQQMQEQIVAGLRAAVLVVDGDGVIRVGNPAAVSVLGIRDEDIDRPIGETDLLQRLPGLERAIADVRSGEERAVLSAAPLAGPQPRQLDVLATPFGHQATNGGTGAVLVVAEDVTEELRTKALLIETERLAAIGRMAAHVTHEVRNPLSSIGLNVELLEDELGQAQDETKGLLGAIRREIEHLRGITEEYLRVARTPDPHFEPESIEELVHSTAQFLRPELQEGGVSLRVRVQQGLPQVRLDEVQIRQVLRNLLKNAREAMPDGGAVELSAERSEGGVLLSVRDEGLGMTPEEVEHVFDLFYTTKQLGTGLGLPLSHQIVLAHGGRIHCESTPGRGTTFEVWLPADASEPSGLPAAMESLR